jgi:hypothetical protein
MIGTSTQLEAMMIRITQSLRVALGLAILGMSAVVLASSPAKAQKSESGDHPASEFR